MIPALGWPLGTRAQMFWLEEGLPSSLRPGARPRTTLCPGLALRDGQPYLAWGTPGGDQQEQWALHVFLNHVDRGLNLQEAIDAPDFHTDHLISSFYPRGFAERSVTVEERFGDDVGGRPAPARPRRRGRGPVVARPRHRRRPRARRPAEGRREPARDAGLRAIAGRSILCRTVRCLHPRYDRGMEPLYKPEGVEERWQRTWEEEGLYRAGAGNAAARLRHRVPPPNVTGDAAHGPRATARSRTC